MIIIPLRSKLLESTKPQNNKQNNENPKINKKVYIDNKKINYIVKKDEEQKILKKNNDTLVLRHNTQNYVDHKIEDESNDTIEETKDQMCPLKLNFEEEPPASPSSKIRNIKQSTTSTEESKEEYYQELRTKKENSKNGLNKQKDQDNIDEEIVSNDSYLDCFIEDAILIEDKICKDTPLHEQTTTHAQRNELNFNKFDDIFDSEYYKEEKECYSKFASSTIIDSSPVLLKPIVEFLIKPKIKKQELYEESKFDHKLNIKYDKGYNESKLGVDILFTIDPDIDNLISSSQEVSVYCKFIDFYQKEMNEQTKFLYSLISSEEDCEVIKGHDYTAGTVCNMIMFGVIKCNFEYVRELLTNPENEKLYNTHIDTIDVQGTYGDMYQTIIYNKALKAMSMWYRKRSFDLAHYSFDYNGSYYVVERSVEASSNWGMFSVKANVLAKILVIEPKSRKETFIKKYYVVDYGGDWSTSNQIIQMALKETELEFLGIGNYISVNYKESRTHIEESKEKELRDILQSILPVPIIHEPINKFN